MSLPFLPASLQRVFPEFGKFAFPRRSGVCRFYDEQRRRRCECDRFDRYRWRPVLAEYNTKCHVVKQNDHRRNRCGWRRGVVKSARSQGKDTIDAFWYYVYMTWLGVNLLTWITVSILFCTVEASKPCFYHSIPSMLYKATYVCDISVKSCSTHSIVTYIALK